MTRLLRTIRAATLLLLALTATARAQPSTPAVVPPAGVPGNRPLPDIVAMMRDVESNQRKAETVEKDYIYHSVETEVEKDGNGQTRKTTVNEFDHFWIDGVPVRRLVRKNGKDLSAEELAREDQRIDKEAEKAREHREQEDAKGKETDARGEEEVCWNWAHSAIPAACSWAAATPSPSTTRAIPGPRPATAPRM
jgi:hypothetical protein